MVCCFTLHCGFRGFFDNKFVNPGFEYHSSWNSDERLLPSIVCVRSPETNPDSMFPSCLNTLNIYILLELCDPNIFCCIDLVFYRTLSRISIKSISDMDIS